MSEAKFKTMRHIETVRNYLNAVIGNLLMRAEQHDQSKLMSPEVEIFEIYTPKLRGCTYGSKEYKQYMKEMQVGLDNHYFFNRHHPEHYVLWKCVVCGSICKDEDKVQGPDDKSKTFFCPLCCKHGMIYECSLEPHVGLDGMTLVDLIEMLFDWKAATLRHNDGDIMKSIEMNQKRFNYSDELKHIFKNTILGFKDVPVFNKANES